MPLISVIMGTYNETDRTQVERAVDSILGQTLTDFEYIICDDGSKPEFYQWLKGFCAKDTRIRLLRNRKNRGLSGTLNRCFQYALGKYIARMDADDISLPWRLEKQLAFLEANTDYTLVGCNVGMMDKDILWGKRILKTCPTKYDFLQTSAFIHPAVMMRREVMERLHGYAVGKKFLRVEDYDFFMRVYAAGFVGYNMQEVLFFYREGAASYHRRKYRFRINECRIRFGGFLRLGILKGNLRYVLKPLVVGLIPMPILRRYRVWKFGSGYKAVSISAEYLHDPAKKGEQI